MPTQHSCWTKSCMNYSIIIPMMTKQNIYQNWIMMAELLVRWTPGWCFKNDHELVNVGAVIFLSLKELHIFNVWVRYFVWNFKGYLWNSTQNISPIHWKMGFLYMAELSKFFKCPLGPWLCGWLWSDDNPPQQFDGWWRTQRASEVISNKLD